MIVTLTFDDATFDRLDALRREHYPRAHNVVPAHLTLFPRLPDDAAAEIEATLVAVAVEHAAFPVAFGRPYRQAKGVALPVDAPPLDLLREDLARRLAPWLAPQDRGPFHPHVTVQSKVDERQARATMAALALGYTAFSGTASGLVLWRYDGGPWCLIRAVQLRPEAADHHI